MAKRGSTRPEIIPEGPLPDFPLRVVYPGGDEYLIERQEGPETELEFYVPGERGSKVTDAKGRAVHLRVEACEIKECRLIDPG